MLDETDVIQVEMKTERDCADVSVKEEDAVKQEDGGGRKQDSEGMLDETGDLEAAMKPEGEDFPAVDFQFAVDFGVLDSHFFDKEDLFSDPSSQLLGV